MHHFQLWLFDGARVVEYRVGASREDAVVWASAGAHELSIA